MREKNLARVNGNLRRKLADWQRASIGLLLLAVVGNAVLCGLLIRREQEAALWESKYNAASAIERDAVEAYGKLLAQIGAEEETRAAQTAAYEALEGYQYIGECTITYYCCEAYEHICGTGDGITASGLPVAPGMVAVDPDIIPLGSTVVINGTSYLAADTGVEGLHIDVAVPTHQEALALGVETAQVWMVKAG